MRPLLRPVASSSWSWPNLNLCHSILTQRLCFSGTEEPKARPQTMSPQSMVCSLGSPGSRLPSLFCRDSRRGPAPLDRSSFLTELGKEEKVIVLCWYENHVCAWWKTDKFSQSKKFVNSKRTFYFLKMLSVRWNKIHILALRIIWTPSQLQALEITEVLHQLWPI